MNIVVKKIVAARKQASAGVDFSARSGAECPFCGNRARIYKTSPWEDNTRIRYHRCENGECPICTMEITIKSIEVDK